jgi:hypothetical protein
LAIAPIITALGTIHKAIPEGIALLLNATKEKQGWVTCRETSLRQSAISLKVKLTKLSDGV